MNYFRKIDFSIYDTRKIFESKNTITFLKCILVIYCYLIYKHITPFYLYDSWSTGDWLINYSGGFVRRGLLGELILFIAETLFINPVYVVVAFKIIFFTIFFGALAYIIQIKKLNIFDSVYFFMPWALSFNVLNAYASGRKELIFLALFLGYIALNLKKERDGIFKFCYLLPSFLLMIFSHEGAFFFLQFFLVYELLHNKTSFKKLASIFIPLYAISCISMVILFVFKGDASHESAILASIEPYLSIEKWTTDGAIHALNPVFVHKLKKELLISFSMTFLLFFISILLYLYAYRSSKKALLYLCLGMLLCSPLYILAVDWGRWMHITFFSVFICFYSTREIKDEIPVSINIYTLPAIALPFIATLFFMDFVVYKYSIFASLDNRLYDIYNFFYGILYRM